MVLTENDDLVEQLMTKVWEEIKQLQRLNNKYREALEYIADMPDGWEEDKELNLLFVVDSHVKYASEVLLKQPAKTTEGEK